MDDDRAAIACLVYAYAERLDAGDLDGVAALFADATVRGERSRTTRQGVAEIAAFYHATVILRGGSPCTRHVVTNLRIDVDAGGMTAASRCAFTVLQGASGAAVAGDSRRPLSRPLRARPGEMGVRRAARIVTDLVGDLRWHVRR